VSESKHRNVIRVFSGWSPMQQAQNEEIRVTSRATEFFVST
jgi:hypothetical protein